MMVTKRGTIKGKPTKAMKELMALPDFPMLGDGKNSGAAMAAAFGFGPLHPLSVELNSLKQENEELKRQLGRPYVQERGPWRATHDGRGIESDDFTHDVVLAISGDFSDDEQRRQYADEIARRLNSKAWDEE